MIGTALVGTAAVAQAPVAAPVPAAPTPAAPQGSGTIKSITVSGNQRLEADTVRSYIKLKAGDHYDHESLDQAIKDLYASELFANVSISGVTSGDIVLQVRENPVINRIVLEGNKRIKEEKIRPEIKLAPREIFTRSKARADVNRIIELYKRQGRYAATVEPKMVLLDQNRVDVVFEIHEGDKSRIQAINIIGNKHFSDKLLRAQMATKTSGLLHLFSGGTSYDPDRLAYDQQKLRQFYLTAGYADFHVVSAVAELTPDKRDFVITYVVDEGDRYKFGDIKTESDIRDLKPTDVSYLVKMKKGDWYNAKQVEDTIDSLSETAGLLGYAFADVKPNYDRDKDARTMSITFQIANAPRVYVEKISINGNTVTRDKVVRREFRLNEGDAFNGFRVKRSRDRIQSLGFFQDKLEIDQKPGSTPDRVVLETNLQEKSTGQLQVSAGYSSLERFIVSATITQSNWMGKGQELSASANYSLYQKSVNLGFQEPYLFDHNIAVGGNLFRQQYNSFNYQTSNRNQTYDQTTTGFQIRAGVPLTEYWSLALRYGLSFDDVTLNKSTYYSYYNPDGTLGSTLHCDPLLAGRYLCDSLGKRTISSVGYTLVYDTLNDRIRPRSGYRAFFSQDYAGVGGNVRYLRSKIEGSKYFPLGGFTLSINGQGGYIKALKNNSGPGDDPVRLVDRWYLGGQVQPDLAGFDIRGVGPRVLRYGYNSDGTLNTRRKDALSDDALGGRYYYYGRVELQLPLGSGARELGIRPSLFANFGSVWGVKAPSLLSIRPSLFANFGSVWGVKAPSLLSIPQAGQFREVSNSDGTRLCVAPSTGGTNTSVPAGTACPTGYTINGTTLSGFKEVFLGDTWRPRLSVGIGINWNSPFGPFRIDIAKALVKYAGDDPKLFSFNVGTQF